MKIKCPEKDCEEIFEQGRRHLKTVANEFQHHLYMHHKIDVIESHKKTDQLIRKAQPR